MRHIRALPYRDTFEFKSSIDTIDHRNPYGFDNDQALFQREKIAEPLKINTYFTRPSTSQDNERIENRNEIIRQFSPKKTDFNVIYLDEIKRVENDMNNGPIIKFDYLTPNEVFLQLKVKCCTYQLNSSL